MEVAVLANNESQSDKALNIDKDSQINVVVRNSDVQDDSITISLDRIFHNMKLKKRIYAWVLVLCLVVGICAPLLLYQFTKTPYTVSSVVTLNYDVDGTPVSDLTAPDGADLDLNQITSSYVLQNALSEIELSYSVSVSNLRSNIKIERILTEDSRRQQEVASKMVEDNNSDAYTTVQSIELTYGNRFIVSLTNGFGGEDAKVKYELTESELQLLLDRVLDNYNDYLVMTYAYVKLPNDEIAAIDTDSLDIMESLDLLRMALTYLYDYCDEKANNIKAYRSWRTGMSLLNLMETLNLVKEVNVDYLYSYVHANSIVKDIDSMITSYQYQLRTAQTELDLINENIASTKTILEDYRNDEIYVSMQESDASRSTQTTTDYFNNLILQQAKNYSYIAELQVTISDLQDKINNLQAGNNYNSNLQSTEAELENSVTACHNIYRMISEHMEEIFSSHFYNTYAKHSAALGEAQGFLAASSKNVLIGAVLGALAGCALWFISGLVPEFRRKGKEEDHEKEGDQVMTTVNKRNWLKITFIVLIACTVAGVTLATVLFLQNPDKTYAFASIQFSFDGAADGIAPNGNSFGISDIASDEVLNTALEAAELSEKYTADQLRDCLVARGSYPENIVSQVMSYESLLNFTANREFTIGDYHPTIFSIVLYNDFDSSLSQTQLQKLLNGIMTAYTVYFGKVYAKGFDRSDLISVFSLSDYDYPQQLQILQEDLTQITAYALEIYEKDPTFKQNGLAFNDIYVRLNSLIENEVEKLNANLNMNALTKDMPRMLTLYQFRIKELTNQLEKKKTNLEEIDTLIVSYEKNDILYLSTTDSLIKIDGNSSEIYDNLISQQKTLAEEIAVINSEINTYQLKIQDLLGDNEEKLVEEQSAINSAAQEAAQKQITALTDKEAAIVDDFTTMLKAYNSQEMNSDTVTVSSIKYYAPKLFSGSFIVECIKTAGPFCAVGFMVCLILLIVDRKKEEKSKTVQG